MFDFSMYFQKESIVKSFDVSLDLSAEAAILARYGRLAKNKKPDGKKDLGVEAWNIINKSVKRHTRRTIKKINKNRKKFNKLLVPR